MKSKNPSAVALAMLARGVPKHYTEEEKARRRVRIAAARDKLRVMREEGKISRLDRKDRAR